MRVISDVPKQVMSVNDLCDIIFKTEHLLNDTMESYEIFRQ